MPRFALALAALVLGACGFQLRGDPAVGIKALHLSTVPGSGIYVELRRALSSGATKLVPSPTAAQAHLRILSEAREKNVYTITGTGRVYEFQLRLVVRYDLVVPGRELPLIVPTESEARRVITYSETAPIAKEAEEQLLYKDMQVELAGRILRQIALAQRDL
ncbi:MAG: LPS assembly lipoprotein LptE [Usitatibacter sp.]